MIFNAEDEGRKTLKILGARWVHKSKDNPSREASPEPGKKGSALRRRKREEPEEEEEPDEMDCSICLRKNFLSWVRFFYQLIILDFVAERLLC